MRILYDGQIYLLQKAGGINRYFCNLIRHLPMDFFPVLNTYFRRNIQYPSHPNLQTFWLPFFRPQRVCCGLGKRFFRTVLPWERFELVHPTYYAFLALDDITDCRIPIIFTVHDMIVEIFSKTLDPSGLESAKKRKAIMAAQAILCDSENTRHDLLNHYAIPEERLSVIYLASDIDRSMAEGPESVPSHPYFLYVGSRAQYKGFDRLLAAFAKAVSVRPELRLCVVGAPFRRDETQLVTELHIAGRIRHYHHVDDHHLAKLYRHSLGLVYPSRYEGFGIPLLEAMSCGTVAVAANCSSTPEVVGDAGLLFDPNRPDELVDVLLFLDRSASEREQWIAKGYARAHLFSWEKTAAQTVDVYRSVAKQASSR